MNLIGKPKEEIRIALIENAADNYSPDNRGWVYESRENLENCAGVVERIDLRGFSDGSELRGVLRGYDVVWIGGGNTYYLRWLAQKSGLDQIIYELVQGGMVYGGESAGAIIAGTTIDKFQEADDPGDAPELILSGFKLTAITVVPHCDYPKYAVLMKKAAQAIEQLGIKTICINESQAVVIDGQNIEIVG